MTRCVHVIADDLTGAADSGIAFCHRGRRTKVLLHPRATAKCVAPHAENKVEVIDANSRAASPRHARAAVECAANGLTEGCGVFKKVDSLLRGNIAAEVQALRDDLRAVALAVLAAENAGARFVYRIGPSFVRARTGQDGNAPLTDSTLGTLVSPGAHGLVVVGSHVGLTTRQLDVLAKRCVIPAVELDVDTILDGSTLAQHIDDVVAAAVAGLQRSTVVLHTSRTLVTGANRAVSLAISRRVSAALSAAVARVVDASRPAFVVAKGGLLRRTPPPRRWPSTVPGYEGPSFTASSRYGSRCAVPPHVCRMSSSPAMSAMTAHWPT